MLLTTATRRTDCRSAHNHTGQPRVLIVDTDQGAAVQLAGTLALHDVLVETATSAEAALQAARDKDPTVAVVEPRGLAGAGLQIIPQLLDILPCLVIVAYTEQAPNTERALHKTGAGLVIFKGTTTAIDALVEVIQTARRVHRADGHGQAAARPAGTS